MKKIIIYTTKSCPYCGMAKNYLSDKNITFEEKDVSNNAETFREMKEKSKQLGVPVLDIDGKIIVGFEKEAIDRELGL